MKFSIATLAMSLGAVMAVNDCRDSSFENNSSGGSPLISDCQQIVRNIQGDGSWTIPCALRGEHTYATYGTCAMGAHCTVEGANIAHIGNEDTIDLINDAINRFSFDGKVGASGRMLCEDNLGVEVTVQWGLYHT
ncbi:hypothetical protein K4F52_006893 [Lecanicillium sp. MT-2017a]|nr:hypothetical protein K4F52_006893 [Lecanicillium sp. MT-2017a]